MSSRIKEITFLRGIRQNVKKEDTRCPPLASACVPTHTHNTHKHTHAYSTCIYDTHTAHTHKDIVWWYVPIYNPSTWKVEDRTLGVQSHPLPHNEFETSSTLSERACMLIFPVAVLNALGGGSNLENEGSILPQFLSLSVVSRNGRSSRQLDIAHL